MKKYLSKLFRNNFKFIFNILATSKNNNFDIEYLNLKLKENGPLGKKDEELIIPIDEIIAPRIIKNGSWDYFICNFIKKNINNDENHFFDIGANIGLITRQLQNLNLNISRYYCFEPDYKCFAILKKNVENKNVDFFNFGLGIKNSKYKFYSNPLNRTDNSIFLKNYNYSEIDVIDVDIKNTNEVLSNIINKNNIRNIIYKSDTQGLDEEIFANLDNSIIDKINLLIIEIYNFDYAIKNIELLLSKLKKFSTFFNEDGSVLNYNDLEKIFMKKKEFNLMAKK